MAAATVSTKGQVVIPAEVRASLAIEAGSRVEFVETAEGWLLKPATRPVTALKGMITAPKKPVSLDEMDRAIGRHARRAARA